MSTPKPSAKPKKQTPASGQKSILGFFQRKSDPAPKPSIEPKSSPTPLPSESARKPSSAFSKPQSKKLPPSTLTPTPSSDPVGPSSPIRSDFPDTDKNKENGLPSPRSSPTIAAADADPEGLDTQQTSSPSRKVRPPTPTWPAVAHRAQAKKQVSYVESDADSDDDDDVFQPVSVNGTNKRTLKRRKVAALDDSDGDDYGPDLVDDDDEDVDDFVVPDDSDEEPVSKKRKRPSATSSRKASKQSSPPMPSSPPAAHDDVVMEGNSSSTAQQWRFDPDNIDSTGVRPPPTFVKKADGKKEKAYKTEPEKRYTWLAQVLDADRNPPGHPDYDPRTLYIPPMAWTAFSPFEKQYWEIKSKFWDTIVFFKKGKFYELYENDATVGHQLFDLKLTDRVNMRMVGVPESSLDMWATQFVAKGYKIAKVDQMESALGKEMRERGGPPKKEDKIIRRELSSVLTSGTLVDGSMLQDDMSTYCVAIKETDRDNHPVFGIAFVDTATAQFQLCEFADDVDMTKFETFVAQTRPGELLLEKSCISAKALRILKNNTSPTTIWNYLKPGKEFWSADITSREVESCDYFVSPDQDNIEAWPQVLRDAKEKHELAMSAFGALLQYLRMLKIERDLVTLGNFSWYDPIRKATSLVLDGQSLINLEIFANSFDGGAEGTLFSMLNRCVTPFGKRMLKQWVCHPLADARKINQRLDAVDALNADTTIMDRFTASLSKLPDLERLLSRVHARRIKAQDFVKVIEGFEQIEYTMSLLSEFGEGEGVIGQLISQTPDLAGALKHWRDAFDRKKAKEDGILVPEPGVEEDFDQSQQDMQEVLDELEKLLKQYRRDLGSTAICYRDNGKEIYQLEVPIKIKSVPKNWDQMSATAKVKRYYSPELRKLVRKLQEAQETHGQIVKEVAGRFHARFDENYAVWLAAVKIIAQLDCLISLAKASASLGEPSCRPKFVDSERSVLEFEELRHPCMLTNVTDFIPNDIKLGGQSQNIDLLTGANAAGKSTVLRMTCIAVILAQVGVYLPCTSATLTPVDRIMSRLGAQDNIFAAQSTFFVELSETKKILSEATPRSLVILDELGRGTSSYDGVAVAQAVLHHVATHVGCLGFFATHYHSLATEFAEHPEIAAKRMAIDVDDEERRVTFLYRLEEGVAEGSFGMHCAAMCGINPRVIERAEVAAREWEHTSRLKESLEKAREACYVPLGLQSDVAWLLREQGAGDEGEGGVEERGLNVLMRAIETL
ncbi:dna mismatch repair protein msh6 [Diplodia corticola]|uniref:DNA mismatch repair protein n=1 Tax=Diplodia corticola TaxID=236234 RepID=A0A1J9RMD1_9PEZI|nr:dna mismatch repair protein msh6 [Diplodia corticola]OJD33739.1 dna mismatch repair protein msh6 [Diplodia corticola]